MDAAAAPNKKGRRRKIEIKKIEGESQRQVTFSKRKSGIFTKAAELSQLCGAEIAVIIFSPRGKAFAFGHPSVETLLQRYQTGSRPFYYPMGDASATNDELGEEYMRSVNQLKEEKRRLEMMGLEKEYVGYGRFWWDEDEPIDGMGLEELETYVAAMEQLRNNVVARANALAASQVASEARFDDINFIDQIANTGTLAVPPWCWV